MLPLALVTMHRYCQPFRAALAVKLKVSVLFPALVQLPHVPVLLTCHW